MSSVPQIKPSNDNDCRSPRFLLVIEWDLSLTTGYSINERESTVALLDQFPERIRVISPQPAFPELFSDPRIDYVRSHRRHHPLHYPSFVVALKRKIDSIVAEQGPAAVVFRPGPLPVVPAMTVRAGTPIILKKLGGYRRFEGKDRPLKMRLVSKVANPLFRYITGRCLGADLESHAYARWLPATFGIDHSKLKLIPNAANTRFFSPVNRETARERHGWQRFRHIVGYVGAIDSLRCIDVALDAACRLRDIPGLGFVFVGSGSSMKDLQAEALREGLEERILFPGFVPYTDVPSVISAFDVALDLTRVPFAIGSDTVIGSYSQKIAQYLACGVPVVAWNTPDTEFLDEHRVGATVAPGDVTELGGVLRKFLGAVSSDRDVGVRCRAFACERLSADVIARDRMAFWEELVEAAP